MDWTVHYIDGTTFASTQGLPEDAPRSGVALIVQYVPDGDTTLRKVEWYHDTYCWEHDMWVPHDRFACETYLSETVNPVRLLGYSQPHDKFMEIYQAAKDPVLETKEASVTDPVLDVDGKPI